MRDSMRKAIRVLEPVLIYYLAANMVSMTMGLYLEDAALLTGVTALVLFPLFLWMYRRDRAREGSSGTPSKTRALDYVLAAVLGIICNLIFSALVSFLSARLQLSNAQQESLLAGNIAAQLIGVGILTPAMEEVLFRGLVYRRLKGYTGNTWISALLSAALFAAWHGNMAQALFAFPMAFVLTALYEWRDTLKIPAVFHMAVNISTILL